MTKHIYNFTHETWYDQPACDCCEGSENHVYNCDDIGGSCIDEEECYVEAIRQTINNQLDLSQLKALAKQLNITINIEDE